MATGNLQPLVNTELRIQSIAKKCAIYAPLNLAFNHFFQTMVEGVVCIYLEQRVHPTELELELYSI
jgi:hypothetical protein